MSIMQFPMSQESKRLLLKQKKAFEAKFGRSPGPADPVFLDPNEDTQTGRGENPSLFIPGEHTVVMMTVGLQDTRAGRVKQDNRAISHTFLENEAIRPYKDFGDRLTYVIGATTNLCEQGFETFLRNVVSIRGVYWLELRVQTETQHQLFICDGVDQIRLIDDIVLPQIPNA